VHVSRVGSGRRRATQGRHHRQVGGEFLGVECLIAECTVDALQALQQQLVADGTLLLGTASPLVDTGLDRRHLGGVDHGDHLEEVFTPKRCRQLGHRGIR
jgi:hypothetical protein